METLNLCLNLTPKSVKPSTAGLAVRFPLEEVVVKVVQKVLPLHVLLLLLLVALQVERGQLTVAHLHSTINYSSLQ
jgi:hypothetical protein